MKIIAFVTALSVLALSTVLVLSAPQLNQLPDLTQFDPLQVGDQYLADTGIRDTPQTQPANSPVSRLLFVTIFPFEISYGVRFLYNDQKLT